MKVVPQLRDSVNVWRDFVPVVQYLRNPDMKDRHWARVNEQTQLFIERGDKLTLGLLLGLQVGGEGGPWRGALNISRGGAN